jgi:hypothetical protein
MLNRKRALKSNTSTLTIKDLNFEAVKKFFELMKRTGKETHLEAMMVILDLLDQELPKIAVDYATEGKIPQHVIEYRKAQGYGEGNFDIVLQDDE